MPRRPVAGFSLLETVVALALLGVGLLFAAAILSHEPLVTRRVEAHQEVLRVLENELEELRSGGSFALGAGTPQILPAPGGLDPRPMLLWTEFEALHPAGLYRVTLRARYFVGPQTFERSLESFLWSPDS